MARVNYAQGKRQRELANKQKREEKAQRKAERQAQGLDASEPETAEETTAGSDPADSPEE